MAATAWCEQKAETVRQMFLAGHGAATIAPAVGYTKHAVWQKLSRMGLRRPPPRWSDEKTEQFTSMWLSGVSISQIREIMGLTLGQVTGKRQRLGLASRGPRQTGPDTFRKPRVYGQRRPKVAPPPLGMRRLSFLDLALGQCRFPLWNSPDDSEKLFCGNDCAEESSYCEFHHVATHEGA